jgi:hypothetical protein
MIRAACRDSTLPFLQESNLADQVQQMNIVPLDFNLEDLSKAWSVFFQTPYLLSIGYKILVVLVEGEESPTRGLPIRDRRTSGLSPFFTHPQVEQVFAQGGRSEPILTDSTLVITGKQLKGDWATQVRLCGIEITPAEVNPTQILVPLSLMPPTVLRAGIQSLQVIHPSHPGQSSPHSGKESNAAPFVLRPRLLSISLSSENQDEDELRSGELELQTNLTMGMTQRVVMVLNEWGIENPASYLFDAQKRNQDSTTITIPFQKVKPGDYLVRLMVDGAETQLHIDDDPDSPTYEWYIGPRVTVR